MPDPYDRKRDADSEARYVDGLVDVEPDIRDHLDYWNGAYVCVVDETAGMDAHQ